METTTKKVNPYTPKPNPMIAGFEQREDGVLITVGGKPLIVLQNCFVVYDPTRGIGIEDEHNVLLGSMLFGEPGNWTYKITGIELTEITSERSKTDFNNH